jgi:uncharacterized protein
MTYASLASGTGNLSGVTLMIPRVCLLEMMNERAKGEQLGTSAWHHRGVTHFETLNLPDELQAKLTQLVAIMVDLGQVVTAFSGGADSAFVAAIAHEVLGASHAHAVTAVSPSLAGDEEADCRQLATEWNLRWTPVNTAEMERAAYRANDIDRCYHCKAELMDVVGPIAEREGATVILGVNVDDLADHRPGQRAAIERGAVFPLVQAGFTKDDVRQTSHAMGLRTWDKPAAACLASRVPYGTPVSVEILSRVDRAEAALHGLGFRQVRVRHYGETARIEVVETELEQALAQRVAIIGAVKAAGYQYVTLDLEGFRSGNLNFGVTESSSGAPSHS